MYTKKNLRQYQDEFIELYKQGVSIRKIATKYGVNKNSVSRLIKVNMNNISNILDLKIGYL